MDKNTLSNYGWIVIAVLVLSVMIALATPFGQYIENAVWSVTEGLFDTSENALGVLGLGGNNGNTDDEEITDAVGSMDSSHTITLDSSLPADTYTLKYENANGVLTDYADICNLESGASYDDFIVQNTAPQTATKIGVYSSSGDRVGSIAFASSFKKNLGNKLYSFGAISDVHIGYETAESDFQNALTYLTQTEKVAFITNNGDITCELTDAQLTTYKNIVDNYAGSTPVYETNGNHDVADYSNRENALTIFETYTGNPLYYTFTQGNDVFIVLGIDSQNGGQIMADGELQWLYETLETNKDKRCFLITHSYIDGSSGHPNNLGTDSIWRGTEEVVFRSLLEHYPNITYLHGHSHTSLTLQSISDTANFENTSGYNSVHIPSLTRPRDINGADGSSQSEGYVIDVYENGIVLRGRDFVDNKFMPIAQYYISTNLKTVSANSYIDDTGTINAEKVAFNWNYGVRLDSSTGAEQSNAEYTASEHISIQTGYTYWVNSNYKNGWNMDVYFYDASGTYISKTSVWSQTNLFNVSVKLTPPTNATTFRFRLWTGGNTKNATDPVFVTRR